MTRIAISKDARGRVEIWILHRGAKIEVDSYGIVRTVNENTDGFAQSVAIHDSMDNLEHGQIVEMSVEQFALFVTVNMLKVKNADKT